MHRIPVSALLLFLGVAACPTFAQPFTNLALGLPRAVHSAVAWGDYDRDGWADFVVAGLTESLAGSPGSTALYRNLGGGNFAVTNVGLPALSYGTTAWGDYDNDGDLDLLTVGNGGAAGIGTIFRNNGNGAFTDIAAGFVPVGLGGAAWLDYDGDGRLDVVVTGALPQGGSVTLVYHNDGDDNFTVIPAGLPGPPYFGAGVVGADFDNDGDPDLLLLGGLPNALFRNDGGGAFTAVTNGIPSLRWGGAGWADYDKDGDLDLALTGYDPNGAAITRVFRNEGGEAFTDIHAGLAQVGDSHLAWADFDNDGWPDLVLTGTTSGYSADAIAHVYRNQGDGTFAKIDAGLAGIFTGESAWGDCDNDGRLDLLVSGWLVNSWDGDTRIYRNLSPPTNAAPQAPSNLLATVTADESVWFSWSPAVDANSPERLGFTYDLRVGSFPGGSDIVSPAADPATGRRLLPAPGASATNQWVLRGLPRGVYYWSVQAIDAGLSGSPFAPEQIVRVTGARPGISRVPDQRTYPGVPVSIPFVLEDDTTPLAALEVFGSSTNTALAPASALVFGGAGAIRTLTVTPAAGGRGTSLITVTVKDKEGNTNASAFLLTVEEFSTVALNLPWRLYYSSAAWGDYDNDGDLDFVIGGEFNSAAITVLYENDGRGKFVSAPAALANVSYSEAVWGDYDRDGYLDLFLPGYNGTNNVAQVYRNNRAGNFTRAFSLEGAIWGGADWGDYDNDGDLDLVYSGGAAAKFYRNQGGTNFVNVPANVPGYGWSGLAGGDFDNDGRRDLVVGPAAALFRNDSRGGFTGLAGAIPPSAWGCFAWGDYDNDGDLDLATRSGPADQAPGGIFRNEGAGVFSPVLTNLPGVYAGSLAWGDYDNDGDLDLLVSGWTGCCGGATQIFRNDSGTFADSGTPLPGASDGTAVFGDFDNDGDLDILLAGSSCALLRNNSPVSNAPPAAPSGLQAQLLPENGVLLGWTAPVDDRTPPSGLNYNLRVGTTPGGEEVMAAQADELTGWRRTPAIGNAGCTNRWPLDDLPRGTYHWSVQAIDGAFAGSPFAPEGTFTITNGRPTISDLADRTTLPGVTVPAIPFVIGDFETAASNLVVTVSSSNTNLAPPEAITVGGSGSNRSLAITPRAHAFGVTVITVTVVDESGLSASDTFTLTVPLFSDTGTALTAVTTLNGAYAAWGDFDRDDDLDLLLGGYTGATVARLYRNDAGLFPTSTEPFVPVYGDTATADFDNDGNLDVFAMGISYIGGGRMAAVYRNQGNATFADAGAGVTPIFRGMPAWGDCDNDGRLDLAVCGLEYAGGVLRVYRNNAGSAFTPAFARPSGAESSLAWGDYDNDGDLDLLFADAPRSLILRNDGPGGFTDAVPGLPGVGASACAWADFDADGFLDFALCGGTTNVPDGGAATRIYWNNGNGTFSALDAPLIGVASGALAWGDFDNDGAIDLLVTGGRGGTNFTRLYLNQGGRFSETMAGLPDVSNSVLAAGDFDRDGDLDLVLGGNTSTGAVTRLFRNQINRANAPPTPPPNLAATLLPQNDVLLSWNPAADDRTPAAGLRYSLRMGTNAGGEQVIGAQANLATGFRRVLETVAAGQGGTWRLNDLPPGGYFWSVQAIDASLAGSAFAAESTFSITNARPSISAMPDLHTVPNVPVTNVFAIGDGETPAEDLGLSAASSDTNLVPVSNIVFGGAGSNRVVLVSPTNGLVGEAVITVTVADAAGASRQASFALAVDEFTLVSTALPALFSASSAWGDYDNDGDLDLLITGNETAQKGGRTKLYRNSAGAFAEVAATGFTNLSSGLGAWGDYDHDGWLDVLLTGPEVSAVYRNNRDGTFTNIQAALPAGGVAAAWGDYDNDGDLDLVLAFANRTGRGTRLYRNAGGNGFEVAATNFPALNSGSIAWGDYDNDGDLDLVLSGLLSDQSTVLRVYRNERDAVFSNAVAGLTPAAASAAWGDYDNDGRLDLLLGGGRTNSVILRNLGDGGFAGVSNSLPQVANGCAAWGDYDNDGRLDILLTGRFPGSSQPVSALYRNQGGGAFARLSLALPGAQGGISSWADYDSDGALDFVLVGGVGQLVRNNRPEKNTLPAAPSGLNAAVETNGWVRFSWVPGPDAQTPAGGLQCNLRVGVTPGGQEVMACQADPLTGQRRVPQAGNAGPSTSWRLALMPGAYYWSVQAIDGAFGGSPFAAEAALVIANHPPSAIPQVVITAEDTPCQFLLAGTDADSQKLSTEIVDGPHHGQIVANGPSLTYQPRTNFFGMDTFQFRVSDGIEFSAPAPVTLIVTPVVDLPGATLGMPVRTGGGLQLSLSGEPYERYAIEASQDLRTWVLVTNLVATSLPLGFVDPDAPSYPHRFYRAAFVPPAVAATRPAWTAGEFGFDLAGEPARTYSILASTNLAHWQPLGQVLLTNAVTPFRDPAATNFPRRFYRLAPP